MRPAAILALAGAACAAYGREFHVDAGAGKDQFSGAATQPFATIKRAQQAVGEAIAHGMDEDVTVYVHPGTYYLRAPLRFGPEDSGRNGHRVIYRNYSQWPRVVGGIPLTNWTAAGGGVYHATVGDLRFNALLENDQAGILAREPDAGYFAADGAGGIPEHPELIFRSRDFPKPFNPQGVQVLVWAGYAGGRNYDWEATLAPVAAADLTRRRLTLAHPTIRSLHAGNRYYLRGAREFLDRPGEFWLDHSRGRLWYKPRNRPIQQQRIVAATVLRIIEIIGQSLEHPAENLEFQGLELRLSNAPDSFGPEMYTASDGLVYLRQARHVSIRDCHISHSGLAAVALDGPNLGHTITGNLIENCAYSGITSRGYWVGGAPAADERSAYVNRGHRFANNYIRRCGTLIGQASGIYLYQSGDNEIANNRIEEMPRYGIRMEGASFGMMLRPRDQGGLGGKLFGKAITWANHLDFLYTRNNRVVRNEIRRCMLDSQDGGGICTFGIGTGNLFDQNLVADFRAYIPEDLISGIYLDDASNDSVIARNIITRLRGPGQVYPMIIKGCDNTITNNILALNKAGAAIYLMQTPHGGLPASEGYPDEPTDRARFARNIFYRNGWNLIYRTRPWKDSMVANSDYNVVWHPTASPTCKVGGKRESWAQWRRHGGGAFESHSLLAPPKFANPNRLDFRLRHGSPATHAGFAEIDSSSIGLTPAFRFQDPALLPSSASAKTKPSFSE